MGQGMLRVPALGGSGTSAWLGSFCSLRLRCGCSWPDNTDGSTAGFGAASAGSGPSAPQSRTDAAPGVAQSSTAVQSTVDVAPSAAPWLMYPVAVMRLAILDQVVTAMVDSWVDLPRGLCQCTGPAAQRPARETTGTPVDEYQRWQ